MLVKIRDLVTSFGDGLHGTPIYSDDGTFYFVNGNNISNGCIDFLSAKKITKEEAERYRCPLSNRTILISINGTLGNIGFYRNEKIALGKSACFINIKENIDISYVYYCLSEKRFTRYLNRVATGSTIKNIAPSQVVDYEIDYPENASYISSLLESIDKQILRNNLMINKLQVLGTTIFSLERPKSNTVKMQFISLIATGKEDANHSSENGIYKFFTCSEDALLCNDYRFSGKSILVAGNGSFNVKFYDGLFNAYQRTYVIKNDELYGCLYCALMMNVDSFKKKSNGSIVKFITIDMLNKIEIPLFTDEVNRTLNSILSTINRIALQSEELLKLKSILLPLLINQQLI